MYKVDNSSKFIISSIMIIFLLSLFSFIHFTISNNIQKNKDLNSFTKVTKLPGIVRSVSYFEPRFKEYKDYSTTLYPKNTNINYLGLIYE